MKKIEEYFVSRSKDPKEHLVLMGIASFLESTVIPIPLEMILIPYYHTHRKRIWRTALVVTIACLLGASLFYWVGGVAMDSWGQEIISGLSNEKNFEKVKEAIEQNGFILILLAGVSPIPFQIAMLAAGAIDYSFSLFIVAAVLARGLRYFGLAALVICYGDRAIEVWRDNKLKAFAIAVAIIGLIYGFGRLLESQFVGTVL